MPPTPPATLAKHRRFHLEGIPPIRAQFFYASPIPIDDPLSAAPIGSSADARQSKLPLRPFAAADNAALERAWLAFASDRHSRTHAHARACARSTGLALEKENADKLAVLVASLAGRHRDRHEREALAAVGAVSGDTAQENGGMPVCCPELEADMAAELRREFCAVARRRQQALSRDRVLEAVMTQLARLRMEADGGRPGADAGLLGTSPVVQLVGSVESTRASTPFADGPPLATSLPGGGFMTARPPVLDDGISGKPFVRVEPTTRSNRSSGVATPDERAVKTMLRERARGDSRASARTRPAAALAERLKDSVELPVGISRLHMVSLPVLQMKPIYWSPVGDIATVLRATWFYRDTMVPVEPIVANQLETGYRELRPWTETWGDELRSALDVGPLGEEKVSHRLWPEPDKRHKGKDDLPLQLSISTDPFCAARCFRGEAAAEGTLEPVHADQDTTLPPPESRMYASYHVIYKDESTAFLLKPSQKPSAYYSRKPVSKIMKGVTVGLPVVRGFDRAAWERVHDKQAASRSKSMAGDAPAGDRHQTAEQTGCPSCQLEQDRGQVTDLVLVAHGIGQKLSERVEAYHFTHYVNAFRRSINIELRSPTVKSVLRPGQNGIMVLPVNWRHLLTFDDGDHNQEDKSAYSPEGFTLKDIEPPTIPAVRSMISDVMFDIPFYMSHLKPKMIAALVGEANRVYRLWCKNNPGFSEKGRVHLIAHSLGSAMAIEVLSKQPTRVPRPLDLSTANPPDTRFFEFDTTNLFLLGSPAGFFLLLERGGLVPRRGRLKPGADAADTVAKDVVGDVGLFGCIAVDNIYNILAKEDPIAYLLNGTIDPVYAAGLRLAYVPSISTSFFKSVGDAVRGLAGAAPAPDTSLTAGDGARAGKPPPAFARMPSQLELEVHDFTREEVAERKAFLLNDNGQIDYFLRSGGGPLEIQYLNMLSAHTSYWTNQDLIRLLCLEIGRVPGRAHALGSMRAVKVRGGFVGEH
ncbi:DDHD domain-containing protein [Staphylotrichum tortipilum]|uniref:DDHD domain-containing protein n=1 Tax=Staphylotrichum tortipilum TaxID=2831512 RepID=A0AAN6MS63_9PEZI|nr:DDHD domain-containing protein [Staphylotrichum longicolle]